MANMLSLNIKNLTSRLIPPATSWFIGACMEARGQQELWLRQKPEILTALREQAIIQSTESSNRLEGVTVEKERLKPIVLGTKKPRDRSEEELVGYRRALQWIFSRKFSSPLKPEVLLHLHALAQGGNANDAGKWKQKDNAIIEILPSGDSRIRFQPPPAKEAPKLIKQLCVNYQHMCSDDRFPILLTLSTFVFDFLCIHPFRDGNGRVSRLLTTLLLQENGFEVARFVSLERLVEENKHDYYEVLGKSSQGWHQQKNELVPWWNFFLSNLKSAYQNLQTQVENKSLKGGKTEIIQSVIRNQFSPFSLADLKAQLPAVSTQMIKKVLMDLKNEKYLTLSGRGRGALWKKKE